MHSLLLRQLKRHFGAAAPVPSPLVGFVDSIQEAYSAFDADRLMLERSLELSSTELLQSNADMRAILQSFPDLFFRLDAEGSILDVKGDAADLLLPPQEYLGKRFAQIPHEPAFRALRAAIQQVRTSASMQCIEYPLTIRGRERFFEARIVPLIDDQIIVIVRNITDQTLAQRELAGSLSLLSATLESTADGILVVGRASQVVHCNRKFQELWGVACDAHNSEDRALFVAAVTSQLTEPDTFLRKFEELNVNSRAESLDSIELKDGRIFEGYSQPQTIAGLVVGTVWSFRDITAKRRSAEELATQRSFLRQVIDLDPNFVFAKDRLGRFTLVNQAFAEAYGTNVEALVGKTDADFNSNSVEVEHFRRDDLETMDSLKEKIILEESLTDASGATRWLHTIKRPIISPNGRADQILGVSADITERRNLEGQLLQSQKMEAVGLLAGGVAHDFNNLLGVITGYAELSATKLPVDSPAQKDLSQILAAGLRAAELTRKLLAFSRRQILQVELFDVNKVLEDFSTMIARILGEDVEVRMQRIAEVLQVRADPGQIEQVLLNLCTNARHAMPLGGHLLIESCRIRLDDDAAGSQPGAHAGDYVKLSVTDSGVGMDAKTLARIFEPFFTTKAEGTGLGLATVYGIVQQHGGFVRVRSEPGRGTTFDVCLPLEEVQIENRRDNATVAPAPGIETILIVEDEPLLRELVAMSLSDLGYQVLKAGGGEEALKVFEERYREISIVILDVVMPKLSGPAVYARMKMLDPGVQVIFVSGYAPESLGLDEIVRRDGLAFVPKPFSPRALAVKIRTILDEGSRNGVTRDVEEVPN